MTTAAPEKKRTLPAAIALILAFALALGLAGCTSSDSSDGSSSGSSASESSSESSSGGLLDSLFGEEDGIYVVSSVVSYDDDDTATTTFELDENGNVTESATSGDDEGPITYVNDENGFYTQRSYYYEYEDEVYEVVEARSITEMDDDGRPLEITSYTYYDGDLTYYDYISYTYYDDGTLATSETTSNAGYVITVTYNEDGFRETYQLDWSSVAEFTDYYEFTYETDDDGNVVSCTTTTDDGDESTVEYEYDRHGNIITVTQDGETLYEYTYELIEDPSLAAISASSRKVSGPLL